MSLPAVRDFLKKSAAYRWDSLDHRWIRVVGRGSLWPGLTLLVQAEEGGYDPDLGWTGAKDRPVMVVPELKADECQEDHAMAADPASFVGRFVHLIEHSDDVAREMEQLLICFEALPDIPEDDLRCAARWHDAGKAHPAFQHMLLDDRSEDDPLRQNGPWAKSDDSQRPARYQVVDENGKRQERKHFRHELASALLLLQDGGSDLAAYLVAAHHGKVRLSIRSLPGEVSPSGGQRFARGIWEGDELPALDLGAGVRTPQTALRLSVMELGEGADGPSWLERTLALRERYGPFRLAWLEALLRVADWHGTRAGSRMEREEVMQSA